MATRKPRSAIARNLAAIAVSSNFLEGGRPRWVDLRYYFEESRSYSIAKG